MNLPFTPQQFFGVFGRYNEAVWPLQVAFVAIAVVAATGVWVRPARFSRFTVLVLAALWLWVAVVYHAIFFRPINGAAAGFAVLFSVEAVVLAVVALRGTPKIEPTLNAPGLVGLALVVYALLIYPILGVLAGHKYPFNPTFSLPCPTTLFTAGVLLWTRPLKIGVFVIPIIWSVIGLSAALTLGVYEDGALLVAACAVIVLTARERRLRRPVTPLVGPAT